ncbi:hypothetical protein J7M22_19260 [Candidatus Poribacteria bacterium]|nr:hypothetical protein [Candidatus Poribacteria bacterium]
MHALRRFPNDSLELLGSDEPVRWSRDPNGLTVTMPDRKPCDHAFVLKITTR